MIPPLDRQDFMYLLGCFLAFPSSGYTVDFSLFQISEVKAP